MLRRVAARLLPLWGLAALLWGLASPNGQAQPQDGVSQAAATTEAPFVFSRAGQRQARLSFFTQRNLIVVSARLNGAGPYNFLLDTGVASCLLTDPALADSLHLSHGDDFRVMGAGGNSEGLHAYEAANVQVTMRGIVAPQLKWLVLSRDVLDLSGYVGMPIHGIIGSEFFRSFTVTIHPEQFELLLHEPASYQAPKGRRWATLPLHLEGGKAYLTAEVRQLDPAGSPAPLPLQLVLDTGAGHALSLETTADHRLRLPTASLRTDLGRGLTGVISGALGRVAGVRLGCYQLPQVLTSFPDSSQVRQRMSATERRVRQGNLGYEVLKRFVTVIDYPHQRLLLRPTPSFHEPFEHDMSGIDLLATGTDYRRYLIQNVRPGSPAEQAGVEPEEELVSIDFMPVTTFTISELSRLFHSQDGRLLVLVLRRPSGNLHAAAVRLKRQI